MAEGDNLFYTRLVDITAITGGVGVAKHHQTGRNIFRKWYIFPKTVMTLRNVTGSSKSHIHLGTQTHSFGTDSSGVVI